MKTRNGFVSNSSSSSYIIGAGRIVDKEALLKFLTEHNIKEDLETFVIVKINDEILNEWDNFRKTEKHISVVAPVNSEPTVSVHISNNPLDEYLLVCVGNDEGDTPFCTDFYELDYDQVDYNWFNTQQRALIDVFNEPFIKNGRCIFGAERNG